MHYPIQKPYPILEDIKTVNVLHILHIRARVNVVCLKLSKEHSVKLWRIVYLFSKTSTWVFCSRTFTFLATDHWPPSSESFSRFFLETLSLRDYIIGYHTHNNYPITLFFIGYLISIRSCESLLAQLFSFFSEAFHFVFSIGLKINRYFSDQLVDMCGDR